MNKKFDTKEILDSIIADTLTYEAKIERLKFEIERAIEMFKSKAARR